MNLKRLQLTARIKKLGTFERADLEVLLDRLEPIAGDDIIDPDLHTVVRLYKREIIGRKAALTKE